MGTRREEDGNKPGTGGEDVEAEEAKWQRRSTLSDPGFPVLGGFDIWSIYKAIEAEDTCT